MDPTGHCGLTKEKTARALGGLRPMGAAGLAPSSDTPAGLPDL